MNCWSLASSLSLAEIGRWCISNHGVDRLLISARLDQDASTSTLIRPGVSEAVERIFGARVLQCLESSVWPGTELGGHSGRVYVVRFEMELLKTMAEEQDYLSGWTQWNDPPLPEDLCLFREGDCLPVLVSVTHEADAWILSQKPLDLDGAEKVALKPTDLLIPRGDFFIRKG